jgi:hypothetical protein
LAGPGWQGARRTDLLSTIGVEAGANGPTLPMIAAELEGIEPIDRRPRIRSTVPVTT